MFFVAGFFFAFFFQAENGILDSVASRGLGEVYRRQQQSKPAKQKQAKASQAQKARWRSSTKHQAAAAHKKPPWHPYDLPPNLPILRAQHCNVAPAPALNTIKPL